MARRRAASNPLFLDAGAAKHLFPQSDDEEERQGAQHEIKASEKVEKSAPLQRSPGLADQRRRRQNSAAASAESSDAKPRPSKSPEPPARGRAKRARERFSWPRRRRSRTRSRAPWTARATRVVPLGLARRAAAAPVSPGTIVGALSAKDGGRVAGGAALALAAHQPSEEPTPAYVGARRRHWIDRIGQRSRRSAAYVAVAMLVDGGMPSRGSYQGARAAVHAYEGDL